MVQESKNKVPGKGPRKGASRKDEYKPEDVVKAMRSLVIDKKVERKVEGEEWCPVSRSTLGKWHRSFRTYHGLEPAQVPEGDFAEAVAAWMADWSDWSRPRYARKLSFLS